MQLNETIASGKLIETAKEKLPPGVLCRVQYNINNIGKLNANNRIYEKAVWERVLADKELQENIAGRKLFGQAEHPTSTSQSDLQLTSHVITRMWIDEATDCVMQEMDVLDTPPGRIIDVILKSCNAGVSTRADGDIQEMTDEATGKRYSRVVPEKFSYRTTDFTATPSTFNVQPLNLIREAQQQLSSNSLTEAEKKFDEAILEAIKKAGECVSCKECKNCGNKKDKSITFKSLVKENGNKLLTRVVEYKEKDKTTKGKVLACNENIAFIQLDNGTQVQINGRTPVSLSADGTIVIVPVNDPNLTAPIAPSTIADAEAGCPIEAEKEEAEATALENGETEEEAEQEEEEVEDAAIEAAEEQVEHEESETPEEEDEEHGSEELPEEVEQEEEEANESINEFTQEELTNLLLDEGKEIKDLYKKAELPAPKGKGEHTKAFHKLAIKVAKGYIKKGESNSKALQKGYATAMKQLGRNKSVNKSHQSKDYKKNESVEVNEGNAWLNGQRKWDVPELKKRLRDYKYMLKRAGGSIKSDLEKAIKTIEAAIAKRKNESIDIELPIFENYDEMVDFLRAELPKMKPEHASKFCSALPNSLNESSTSHKELNSIKLKEASSRAEKEKAVELLTEAENTIETIQTSRQIETASLARRLQEAKGNETTEVTALRTALEKQLKETKSIKQKLDASNTSLSEKVKAYNEATKEHEKELNTIKENANKEIVKSYVDMKVRHSGLRLSKSNRALLETCETAEEVDLNLEEIREGFRRDALHPAAESEIEVLTEQKLSETPAHVESIGAVMEALDY